MLELRYVYPNSGYIADDGFDTGAFLQGEDYEQLDAAVCEIYRLQRHKKIGRARAERMANDLLSDYLPDDYEAPHA